MSGALATAQADRLRAAISEVDDAGARDSFLRLVEVLENAPTAIVLPGDQLLSTQAVADHLGVSRMTVVRLIDRGSLEVTGGGKHRKIRASELERYVREELARRRAALDDLASDITTDSPADEVIQTR